MLNKQRCHLLKALKRSESHSYNPDKILVSIMNMLEKTSQLSDLLLVDFGL